LTAAERGEGFVRPSVADELERRARARLRELEAGDGAIDSAEGSDLPEQLRLLRQVTTCLGRVDPADLAPGRAGFGSQVVVENLETHAVVAYTLMLGDLIDIEAGQVSLASPIGQALRGARPGASVEVVLPGQRLRLRVQSVRTLPQLLGLAGRSRASAAKR
jgi:transcription elongation factor GreA